MEETGKERRVILFFKLNKLFVIHSSSRSMDLEPPPKRPMKKLCFGGSGISWGWNNSPIISGKLWLKNRSNTTFSYRMKKMLSTIQLTKIRWKRKISAPQMECSKTAHVPGYWSKTSWQFYRNTHTQTKVNSRIM
jgi:hypothetical protein